jgi:hypothetical protein
MAAAFVITLVIMSVDPRTIDGSTSVWAKPLKFELSLALHAATLAVAMSLLSAPHRQGMVLLLVAVGFLTACLAEMGYIIVQGARGQHSHFNVATPFLQAMYTMMAIAAVVIVGAAGAIGVAFLTDTGRGASPALRWAIALGFIGGTVLTLVTAFTIGGRLSPYVGGIPAVDARMALTGWSQSSGDLRVSHFLATHMIQVLPLAGLLLDRILAGRAAVAAVLACAVVWALLTLGEYRTAMNGQPSRLATAWR